MDVNRRTRMSTCRQVNIKRYYRHDDKLHSKYLIMTNQLYAHSGLSFLYSAEKLAANLILGNTMFQTYLKDFLVALLTLGAL